MCLSEGLLFITAINTTWLTLWLSIRTFQNPPEGFGLWMNLLYKSYDMHWQVNAVGSMLIPQWQVLAGPVRKMPQIVCIHPPFYNWEKFCIYTSTKAKWLKECRKWEIVSVELGHGPAEQEILLSELTCLAKNVAENQPRINTTHHMAIWLVIYTLHFCHKAWLSLCSANACVKQLYN